MSKPTTIVATLLRIKNEENGHIVYRYADGTSQRQPINKQVFFDEKKNPRDIYKIVQDFNAICHDMGAVDYTIE